MDAFEFITGADALPLLEVLNRALCQKCGGTGEVNDAEPGDIMFNTWVCSECNGKGWNEHAVAEIVLSAGTLNEETT